MSAQNSSRQYAYIAETTFGTTPSTPQTQLFAPVEFTLEETAGQVSDPSINAHRQNSYSRPGNRGVSGDLSVVMCPDNYDVFLEAVMGGTWTGNTLKIGNTKRSFSVEEGFTDIGQFRVFSGVMLNSMSLAIAPDDQLIQATFNAMGGAVSPFTGTSIDVSPTPIPEKDKFFHEGATISEGGTPVAFVTGLTFEMTNNLSGNYAIGSTSYFDMSLGRVAVTGTVTAFFESAALYNKYRNNTGTTLSFTLAAGSPSETLTFSFPDVRYTSGSITRGTDGPVQVELQFESIYDTTDGTSLIITRSA